MGYNYQIIKLPSTSPHSYFHVDELDDELDSGVSLRWRFIVPTCSGDPDGGERALRHLLPGRPARVLDSDVHPPYPISSVFVGLNWLVRLVAHGVCLMQSRCKLFEIWGCSDSFYQTSREICEEAVNVPNISLAFPSQHG